MDRYEYTTSEKAFLDVWNEFGNPKEIIGTEQSYNFLKALYEKTEGMFIVDHFSGVNYDHLTDIEFKHPYNFLYWKNFEKYPIENEMEAFIFGYSSYIYSLCNIQKLLFINVDGHLFVIIMPVVATEKEMKKFLGINNLNSEQLIIDDYPDKFYTTYTFTLDNKIHRCFSHYLPFYSFLLQPKERNLHGGISKNLIFTATNFEIKKRLNRIDQRLKDDFISSDYIYESGNTLRRILEYMLKYYVIYKKYNLPNKSYGHNMMNDLNKHLAKMNDGISEFITADLIRTANELSHDSGKVFDLDEIQHFLNQIKDIQFYIEKHLQNRR